MKTYTVRARKWRSGTETGWELRVDGIGVTQVDDLGKAKEQARDFIETVADAGSECLDIEILAEDPVG